MKKVVNTIILIVLILVSMNGNVNAEEAKSSANISLNASKKEVNLDEQFSINIRLSNIKSKTGIIGFEAALDYDKKQFELIKMEGQNDWETPKEGFSYNSSNGIMVSTKNGFAKESENIIKITFKVKNISKNKGNINLKDITLSDSDKPIKVSAEGIELTLKAKENTSTNKTSNTQKNTLREENAEKDEENEEDKDEEQENTIENEITNEGENTIGDISEDAVQTNATIENNEKNQIYNIIVIACIIISSLIAMIFMIRVYKINHGKKKK